MTLQKEGVCNQWRELYCDHAMILTTKKGNIRLVDRITVTKVYVDDISQKWPPLL